MSAAYSWDEGSVEGEVAIVTEDPVAGNRTEGAEGGARVSGPGLGALAARRAPGDGRWTSWGQNSSCRNPHSLGASTRSPFDTT